MVGGVTVGYDKKRAPNPSKRDPLCGVAAVFVVVVAPEEEVVLPADPTPPPLVESDPAAMAISQSN